MVASPSALPAHRLRRTLEPLIRKAATRSQADRYRKRFSTRAHLWMLLIHAMSGGKSLRQSHARLCAEPALLDMLGMEEPISLSQLARSSTSRPALCFELVLASLLGKARAERAKGASVAGLRAGEVELLDSTFLFLGARRSPWARHGKHPAGVRVQTAFDLLREVPSAIEMTTVGANDSKALSEWDLSALKGKTVIFDLGYYSHANLARLRGGGVHFLTRLNKQASYEVRGVEPLPEGSPKSPEGDEVLSDQSIDLVGSPNNRNGTVVEGVRLLTSRNAEGEVHRFVSDRFDLPALTLVRLYRKRWRIELFFRWLKDQLGALRPLGTSEEAVWLTIVIAAIVALLTALSEHSRPRGMSRVSWLVGLSASLSCLSRPSGYG